MTSEYDNLFAGADWYKEGGAVATYKRAFTGGAEGDATVVDAQSLYPYVAPQRAPL